MRRELGIARGAVVALGALLVSCAMPARSQDEAPPGLVSIEVQQCDRRGLNDVTAAACRAVHRHVSGLKVASVSIKGRWSRHVSRLPLKAGDSLTPESLSAAMEALRDTISRSSSLAYLKTQGEFSVLYISVEFSRPDDSGSVAVQFIPRYVDVSLVKVGDNVLPLPRADPWPFTDIPIWDRALNPSALLAKDEAFGTSLTAALDRSVTLTKQQELTLAANGRVSLDEPVHEAQATTTYRWHQDEGRLRAASASLSYEDDRTPIANQIRISDARVASGGLQWKVAPNTRLYLDTLDRNSHDRLTGALGTADAAVPANEQMVRVLFERIPQGGEFMRAALWAGTRSVGGSFDASHELVIVRLGWEREFAIRPSQTIGLEVTAGAGRLWGRAPSYEEFFAGNTAQKFLYDAPDTKTMLDAPGGPLLRSFGEAGAGINVGGVAVGGTRFWHVNVDLTLPIPRWSSPLIPDESADIQDAQGRDVTLKQLMANQVDVSGPSFMQSALMQQGLSFQQAQQRTAEVMGEIRPAAHYIIDDANLIAIKPLLVFDAAGLSGSAGSDHWLSAGVGVQLTIVIAKFEGGYSRTLQGPTFGKRGAPFARLVFQRLF